MIVVAVVDPELIGKTMLEPVIDDVKDAVLPVNVPERAKFVKFTVVGKPVVRFPLLSTNRG